MFIDYARIKVHAGNGGKGCISFRREKFVPKGGPDGGDGGKGGDIIAVGNENINTLLEYRYLKLYKAKRGQHGSGKNKTGRSGESRVLQFPLGTIIYDITEGKRELLAEIDQHNQQKVIAKGGMGGKGNASFASSTNRAPRTAEDGGIGEEKELELELKLIADVGLVGFPNAGKSTLLSKVSAAHPKIANYPFTTLEPSLGVVSMQDYSSFVIADIPGIIEGAHEGKGLGLQFLRHIERTRVLLFLIDINSSDPQHDYQVLSSELYEYDKHLQKKPHLIALNKLDTITGEARDKKIKELEEKFTKEHYEQIVLISAATGENVDRLKNELYRIVKKNDSENKVLD
ncbi:MAG: GTPase ObgE [Candidatus Cloacimonetes bacterium]|nr:GTPase ObgE [Candidatus Cloacimonadota bacterium]